jgi:uncharacterized membrane protein YidH (DUF202 family)
VATLAQGPQKIDALWRPLARSLKRFSAGIAANCEFPRRHHGCRRTTMLVVLIVLGALLIAIGYALPDQYTAASKRQAGADKERADLMENIALSLF